MDLSNVKIGDVFLVGRRNGWSRSNDYYVQVKCESITDKQCVIGTLKYRKQDGRPIGHDVSLYNFNDELWLKGQKFLRRKFVENYQYHTLTDEASDAIYKILKVQEK